MLRTTFNTRSVELYYSFSISFMRFPLRVPVLYSTLLIMIFACWCDLIFFFRKRETSNMYQPCICVIIKNGIRFIVMRMNCLIIICIYYCLLLYCLWSVIVKFSRDRNGFRLHTLLLARILIRFVSRKYEWKNKNKRNCCTLKPFRIWAISEELLRTAYFIWDIIFIENNGI